MALPSLTTLGESCLHPTQALLRNTRQAWLAEPILIGADCDVLIHFLLKFPFGMKLTVLTQHQSRNRVEDHRIIGFQNVKCLPIQITDLRVDLQGDLGNISSWCNPALVLGASKLACLQSSPRDTCWGTSSVPTPIRLHQLSVPAGQFCS